MSLSPSDSRLSLRASRAARGAAIAGTRALVADETFHALVALLIASGAVQADDVRATVKRLAEKLSRYADGHPEFVTHPGELALQARRLENVAAGIS